MTQMPTVTQQPTTGPHSLCPRVVAECIQPPLPAHEVPGQNTLGFSGINGQPPGPKYVTANIPVCLRQTIEKRDAKERKHHISTNLDQATSSKCSTKLAEQQQQINHGN